MIEEISLNNQSGSEARLKPKKSKSLSLGELLAGKNLMVVLGIVLIMSLGVFSGWLLAKTRSSSKQPLQTELAEGQRPQKGEEFGLQDKESFPDHVIGEVAEGGINGEGTHHLLREGGPSQTVFLFSSVLDLESFVGRKVEIWGETFSAEKAGWLMDVGKLKLLD
ncbi:MAG: hypothetical protein PHX72_01940 [Candidatus Shapirobacteria bacterium]|nr:hypothetical protein [Candidatus Shapirobacteria bacterium]